MKAAHINLSTALVENIIMADASKDPPEKGYLLVDVTNAPQIEAGYSYINGAFVAPPTPPVTKPAPLKAPPHPANG